MENVAFKGLAAHKLRLAMTALAIMLGVTLISGTFADIAAIQPRGLLVGTTVANDAGSLRSPSLSFLSAALLILACLCLLGGAVVIFSTFSIIVDERSQELALLRLIGASRRQVFESVLAEAAVLGLLSSGIGAGLGTLAAVGLPALLRDVGSTLLAESLVFAPRSAVVGVMAGVAVTLVAAIGPARRAARLDVLVAIADR
jgi:putative ABC transport system permease protein